MGWFSSQNKSTKSSTLRSDFQSDKWELDAEFFSALSKWTLDHPESTLDRVLERIDQAIEGGKNYMELIPDTPFPARGLVKAVAQLIQLSAKISRGQGKVRDFSFKIINWVNRVKESFTKAGNGQFTERTWSNLASMRELIDEICGWASERLKDNRWNILNTKIEDEICDFEARLDDAEKLFNVQSLIVLSGGLDAILQFLFAILRYFQSVLTSALEHLRETQEKHIKRILEEQERKRFIDESLRHCTVQDSTYIAQKKRPCDSNTRMENLKEIEDWIDDCTEPRLHTNASLQASLVHNSLSIATITTQPTPTVTFPLLLANLPDVLIRLNGIFMTHSKDRYTQSPHRKKRQRYLLILLEK